MMIKIIFLMCLTSAYSIRPQISTKLESLSVQGDGSEKHFGDLHVVCTSNSCNKTTESSKANSKPAAIVKNDVVVSINTNIDINNNNTSTKNLVDDTPDVPVVLGLAGINQDTYRRIDDNDNNNNYNNRNFDEFLSNSPDPIVYQLPTYSSTSTLLPPQVINIDSLFGEKSTTPSPIVHIEPSKKPYYHSTHHNNHHVIPSQRNLLNEIIYHSMNDINLHKVPFFDANTYNRHYFGEIPPQPFAWNGKFGANHNNPVAFTNIPNIGKWQPSVWNYGSGVTSTTTQRPCDCNKKHSPTVGLQWYPQSRSSNVHPHGIVKIDDKLAPLN